MVLFLKTLKLSSKNHNLIFTYFLVIVCCCCCFCCCYCCYCCCFFFPFVLFYFVFFFFFFKKQPLRVSFLKNRCSCISKTYKCNSRSGWGFWRMSLGVLCLVRFQTYSLLLDLEISPLGAFWKMLTGFWEHSFLLKMLLSDC